MRIREWQDYESQLRQVAKEMKLDHAARPSRGTRPPKAGRPYDGRHPPGPALRPAQPHRRPRGARQGQAGGAAPDAGVPRRPQRPLRGLPRQRASRAATRLPDERRAGRDLAALGPAERRHQARVGRAPRRPPRQAHLLRAALVPQARGGDGPRAGHAVRRPAGRRPARAASARSTRRWRASSSSGTHWSSGSGTPGTRFLAENPAPPRGGRGARAPRPSPRHRGRRAHPLRVLRRPRRRRRRQRRSTSTSGGSARRQKQPDLLTFDPAMLTHDTAGEVRADTTSRPSGTTATRPG